MYCPGCGGKNILEILIKEKKVEKDNLNVGNACCGTVLFGWPGLLCGLFGRKERETTNDKTAYRCNDCGKEWLQ